MPYCPNCGLQVKENDKFCDKCGTKLNCLPIETASSRFPSKPSTNLVNGVVIGSGITLVVLGLIGAFAFNSYYLEQTNALSAQGLPINPHGVILNSIAEFISLAWTSVFFGIYFLALSIPSQLSPLVRAIWARSDNKARVGNGLITGGFVFATTSAGQAIREFYVPDSSGFASVLHIFIIFGVLIMAVGAALRTFSYFGSNQPNKSLKSKNDSP